MVLQKGRLGEPEADLTPISGCDAVSLVTRLSRESWLETGLELPGYSRKQTPYRFVRESRG
ncbi:MAG: hypothetical protein DPW22_02895 [Alphaproteobacteria bacterium]|nr:hypothetical protein [Sorangiineae bacterium PRO1]MCQ3942147.1 hypothetical protein [Alphaproteobacteria bacterium]